MVIHIHVKPNSKKESIQIGNDGIIYVKICAQPIEGKANKYLLKYLSGVLKIPVSKIEIIKGQNNSRKTILVHADEHYIHSILSCLEKK